MRAMSRINTRTSTAPVIWLRENLILRQKTKLILNCSIELSLAELFLKTIIPSSKATREYLS